MAKHALIEAHRVQSLIDQLGDMVKTGTLSKSNAITLASNLVDTDKIEPETNIERMVFEFIDNMR